MEHRFEVLTDEQARVRVEKPQLDELARLFHEEEYPIGDLKGKTQQEVDKVLASHRRYDEVLSDRLSLALEQGHLVVAHDPEANQVVALIKIEEVSQPIFQALRDRGSEELRQFSGRVFELGTAYVRESVRGKGIYSLLRSRALDLVREKYPEALLISATKHEQLRRKILMDGWKPITIQDFLRLKGRGDESIAQLGQLQETAYYLLPR